MTNILRSRGSIARALSVSVSTVQRWIKHHGLPATHEGPRGQVIVSRAALMRWHAQFCGNDSLHEAQLTHYEPR